MSVYLKNECKSRLYTLEYTARLRSSVELTSLYTLKLQSTQSIISLFPWNYQSMACFHVFRAADGAIDREACTPQ